MKIKGIITYIAAAAVVLSAGADARGASDADELRRAVEASSVAVGRQLGDYALVDQDGAAFRMSDYWKTGRPLIVSFIYTSCPEVCPTITADLKRAADEARKKYGDRFNVLNIGFDPANDTPARLKAYGAHYTKTFSSFRFATGVPDAIARLTAELGFYYKRNADGSFDHIDMASVASPDGRIYAQVYGIRTDAGAVDGRLAELLIGKPRSGGASILDKIRFFCYRYDPYTGRYVFNYAIVAGVVIQSIVIASVVYFAWGDRIRRRFRGRG
ncbi:MAG: SCO family protein [Deltaproteobacteria bacterium]|nr:SCO family protein [Deltaproteobacteria bacterium]